MTTKQMNLKCREDKVNLGSVNWWKRTLPTANSLPGPWWTLEKCLNRSWGPARSDLTMFLNKDKRVTGMPRFTALGLIAFFYKLKVWGNPESSKSIGAIFLTALLTSCLYVTFW